MDLVLTDLPYGTTNAPWDQVIDPVALWAQYRRLLAPGGAVLLFAQQPFATTLIQSNRGWFRYEWIWEKGNATGFLNAKRMPLRAHENVLVFYPRLPSYRPQMSLGATHSRGGKGTSTVLYSAHGTERPLTSSQEYYPRSVLRFSHDRMSRASKAGFHPTQKPVALLEYLIRTYTKPGVLVLDNTMGSGSTGVAAVNTDRLFVGIEQDPAYFATAQRRIEAAAAAPAR